MNKRLWEKCVEFHGHECPGLAIGFKAAQAALEVLGGTFSADEEIVCVTENDACGVDAIQVVAGCSIGKGNLLYRGTGKQAYSFFNRNTGDSVRLVLNWSGGGMDMKQRQEYLLSAAANDIFLFKKPLFTLPEKARIFRTIVCEKCGEGASEPKIRLSDGKKVCIDCWDGYDRGW